MSIIIQFLKKYCPYVKIIELFDASIFVCKAQLNNKTKKTNLFQSLGIPLYDLYTAKYGKGYYEQKFGFKLKNEEEIRQHKINVEATNTIILNEELITHFLEYMKTGKSKLAKIDYTNFIKSINYGETLASYLSRIHINSENCAQIVAFMRYIKAKKINGYSYLVNPIYYKNI
jgi:hypothetical protein